MDKIYSKKALIIKAVFCVCLAPLYMLFSNVIFIDDGFLYLIFSIVPICSLYTIPFWVSASFIRKYRVNGISKYVGLDALSCLLTAFFGVILTEVAYTFINGTSATDGLLTIILTSIFIIVSGIFWLVYLLLSKIK